MLNEDRIPIVPETQDTPFICANCGARYKVVRVEGPSTADDSTLMCIRCDAALQDREDRFVLKYFLVGANPPRHLNRPGASMGGRQRPGLGRGRLRRIRPPL
jgi:hypothetical protein